MISTNNEKLEFDFEKKIWETIITFKKNNKRANYSISTRENNDNKYWYKAFLNLVIEMNTI